MFIANGIKVLRRATYVRSPTASPRCRTLATDRTNYISVTVDSDFDGSVALVKMQKKPVNSFCPNFCREMTKTINDLENNENMRAMIVTSDLSDVFSAGLDYNFLLGATHDETCIFFKELQQAAMKFYGSRLITVCAINGHCMAGGNLLPLAADYSVMPEGPYRVSLNETKLGVPVPFYLRKMLENHIGPRTAARAIQLSSVFTSEEACKLGWVDEIVPIDQVLTTARKEVKRWLEIPDSGRTLSKMDIRRKEIQEIIDKGEEDAQMFARLILRPDIRKQSIATINRRKEE